MDGSREMKLIGASRGPSEGLIGPGTVDDALDGEELAGLVHDGRESVLDLDPRAVSGPNQVFDGRPSALENRGSHCFVDACPVGTRNEVGEGDAPIREEAMRVIGGDAANSGADEVHRPAAIVSPPIKETTEVSDEATQGSLAVGAFDEGCGGGRKGFQVHVGLGGGYAASGRRVASAAGAGRFTAFWKKRLFGTWSVPPSSVRRVV